MKKRIEFFLYSGMAALDVAGPLEVFRAANELLSRKGKGQDGYNPIYSSLKPGPIPTSSGLRFYAEERTGMRKTNSLLVPGGMEADVPYTDPVIIQAIEKAAQNAHRVISVCSGALLLGAARLLDYKRATTHWLVADRLRELYPNIYVEPDAIYVQDGNIFTSGGVTAGIDLALNLVEEDYGPDLAIEVARILLLYRRRPGYQSQFSTPLAMQTKASKRFANLFNWLEKHLKENITVDRLAEQANMSPRTFARIFPLETGMNPGRFVEQLRIDRARELLEASDAGLEDVARESGFGREERLRRAFQRRLGISPAQYRAHFTKERHHKKESHLQKKYL